MRTFNAACLVAGCVIALGHPSSGLAQGTDKQEKQETQKQETQNGKSAKTPPADGIAQSKFTAGAEIGGRGFPNRPDDRALGKFEEYSDLRQGPMLNHVVLRYLPADSFNTYSLTARRVGYRDQSVWLQAMRPGKFDFNLRWDRIPHTYSTSARSPGDESTPGFNTLPTPRPDSIAWRTAPFLDPIRSQWDPVKASLNVSPNHNLDLNAQYLYIRKKGGIPLSLSYNASSGPQREFVGPIDQSINNVRLAPAYASGERTKATTLPFIKSYQLMASYDYSSFSNSVKSTMVDNPQLSVSSPTLGAASSLIAMPPDNSAQTLSFTGAVGLPVKTRVMGSFTSSWMRQNDILFPQTSNDSLRSNANYALLALPRPTFDGKVQTTMFNFSATSSPVTDLRLMARVRRFKRDDNTEPFHISAMAISDRSIAVNDSATTEFNPFTKDNADFSANYMIFRSLSFTGGYSWENWERDAEVRNVGKTKEKGPRVALDYTGIEWLSFHASYMTTERRGAADSADYTRAGTEIVGFRRFDLSDRDRKRTNILATITPISMIDITLNYQVSDDKYPHSLYGTQSDKSNMKGFDIGFSPIDRLTLSGGFSREDATNILKSRYRTGAAGSVTDDNPTYRWTNTNRDHNKTTYVGVNATIIPDKLDVFGTFSNIDARYQLLNVNPQTPTGGTATNIYNATVENWPEIKQNLKPVNVALRYIYSNDWGITLRYQDEKYTLKDFRTSQPLFAPFNGAPGNIPGSIGNPSGSPVTATGQYHFLSAGYLPYTARFFTLMVSYQLPDLRYARGRSAF